MALSEYRRKRDFRKTPEPKGGGAEDSRGRRAFVVQKHGASRLHYDFRLELDGVLKSWAVPKGPSLDPGKKRLAVAVEDHPLEYGDFEGVIPEGEYGGGTVMLWDRGSWRPDGADPAEALKDGALKFTLSGEKLRGRWALVRMHGKRAGKDGQNWLLIKEKDEAASGGGTAVVEESPRSVASGRSLDEIAAGDDPSPQGAGSSRANPVDLPKIAGARPGRMPAQPGAQLARLVEAAPEGERWFHEIKYDGYRLLARIEDGEVRLVTRNGQDWTKRFPALAEALDGLPVKAALIDGELVDLAPDGTTRFSGLQDKIAREQTGALVFFAFDLLHLDGIDLAGAALEERKAALARLIPKNASGILRYSDHQVGQGPAFFREACGHGLEGTIAKRRDRPYRPGRHGDWVKVKCVNREEFVVIGFTEPSGSRQGFGALVLGYYDQEGDLRYAGRVGTGFSDAQLADLRRRLDRLERKTPPVKELPEAASEKGVHWTRPSLVAAIRFSEWTADRILRQPVFEGLREDKEAEEVIYDMASAKGPAGEESRGSNGGSGGGDASIAGVRLSHPDRVLYPGQGITKRDLAGYYQAVADWALPHLAGRPLTLVRCPSGRHKECFFQKHADSGVPEAVRRIEIAEESGTGTYLTVDDLAGLVSLVQMGVLEIHPWGAKAEDVDRPDRLIFDLDPDADLPWSQVVAAALDMRTALDGLGLKSFAKTTGGKGLHVVVPVVGGPDWDEAKGFARALAERVAEEAPERYTTNPSKRARRGRIFIDYLRNARGATAVAAYSARARAEAPVATPLFWEEVEDAVRPDDFTIASVPERLAALKSDPWEGLPKSRQSITAARRRELGL